MRSTTTLLLTPVLTDGATLIGTFTYNLSSLQSLVDSGLLYAYGLVKIIIYLIQYILNFKNVLVTNKIYFVRFLGDKNDTKVSN